MQQAMERGIPRDEIFVTTKLWPRMFGYDTAKRLVPTFLQELNVTYVDLLLMHAPANLLLPGKSAECREKKLTHRQCRQETWRALSELRDEGLLKNIGVSNYAKHHLQELQELDLAPIAVNQISYNPWAPDYQVETFEYCQSQGIAITAYASLGGFLQKSQAESTRVITELSERYNVTPAQIMLRWAIQMGAAVIPGTGNPKHMRENLAVYDFEISDADMARIADLRKDEEAKKFFYMKPPAE
jgi:diketogulonate reductase-like aldo/keto reductase